MKTVAVMATLDTKGAEVAFVRSVVESMGARALVIDTGVLGVPSIPADISREQVAQAAGSTRDEIIARTDKGAAMEAMTRGATAVALQLYASGRIDGLLALGGAQGTGIGTAAMRALPLGVPKLMVSTVANGSATFGPFVGTSDIAILHSVADISGINLVSRTVLSEAAGAIVGMMSAIQSPRLSGRLAIGMTMVGITTACTMEVQRILDEQGYEVIAFHGNGVGPKAMEDLVDAGVLSAVVDLSPHDVTDLLFGGLMPAHANRFRAAIRRKIPLLVAPGATDIILRSSVENIPAGERGRPWVVHNALHTHVRTAASEMRAVGRFVGERLAEADEHACLYVPLRGYSELNRLGGPLYDPEADRAFVAGARETAPRLAIHELDAHINDLSFSQAVAGAVLALLEQAGTVSDREQGARWSAAGSRSADQRR
jgi:uncharacterized protein (UPF0261 family)